MSRPGQRCRFCGAVVLALLGVRLAHAECGSSSRWVEVRFDGAHAPEFERAVFADLRAGLSRERVDVCVPDPRSAGGPPAADVRVEVAGASAIVQVLARSDANERMLERRLELAHLPRDSRGFAVALAADELLHAAWAELEEAAQREWSDSAAPAPGAAAVPKDAPPVRALEPMTAPPWAVGTRAALEHFGGGHTQWGADLVVKIPLAPHWVVSVAGGARQGFDVEADYGRVESLGLDFMSHLWRVWSRKPWELGAGIGLYGAWLDFRGEATAPGAVAARLTGFALYAQAVISAAVSVYGPF